MIEKSHKKLSVRKQCELLDVNRNRLEPRAERITSEDELIMRRLDELHTVLSSAIANSVRNCGISAGRSAGAECAD